MKWAIAAAIIVIALVGGLGYLGMWDLLLLIGKVVLGIVLILAIIGSGLFGYICFKAQARKWGVGLFVVAVLCVVALYWLIVGRLPFL